MTIREREPAVSAETPSISPDTNRRKSAASRRTASEKAIFRKIYGTLRAYLFALLMQGAALSLVYLGDQYLMAAFPWATVSLIVVIATASLWGWGPALFTVVLAALMGDLVVPDLHISLYNGDPPGTVSAIRTVLFLGCGGAIIAITERMRRMGRSAEQRRTVVQSLQHMILPDRLPIPAGWNAAWHYRPASQEDEVGGDFYDMFPLEGGRFGIIIGDVMGKGKEAAMHTALIRYSLRSYLSIGQGPEEALGHVDRILTGDWEDGGTASVFVGCIEPLSGRIDYANAGHEAPLVGSVGTEPATLSATGPILGTGLGYNYEASSVTLAAGDFLLLFTDGVTEARNPSGEFLDGKGAWDLLSRSPKRAELSTVLDHMLKNLEKYTAGVQHDDVALILLHRKRLSRKLP